MALRSSTLTVCARGVLHALASAFARLAGVSHPVRQPLESCSRYEQAYRSERDKLSQLTSQFKGQVAESERQGQELRHYRDELLPQYVCLVRELSREVLALQQQIDHVKAACAQRVAHVCSEDRVCEEAAPERAHAST
ncbi:hypothetical protein N0V87_010760 [Didymella glomerata]|jgi:hypothetical protein|uniref:Uncharacterized protein n=2 Tax=Didymella TaxID=55170 RepID=A0A9P4WGT4_9PLEO|nr:hypothetical protein E8E11_001072 [Didymella keratinophila]KAF3031968.1 hypothetical protein E8E12_000285 [Didymella heteroderae]KAJ4329541.1 hypothetical protein N0V87_010760 [Didymella glomerata]